MVVLITYFEPFGNDIFNSSTEAAKILHDNVNGNIIIKRELSVCYNRVETASISAILDVHPDIVICLGQASSRHDITPETVAVNRKSCLIPDNDCIICSGEPVINGGQDKLYSNLPVNEITDYLKCLGFPASVSDSAGEFVCNCTMYHL